MKKQLKGVVKSDKMKQTAVVMVTRFKVHPKYKKRIKTRRSYLVDNPLNKAKTNQKVIIESTKPISRHKHFQIIKIIKK
jgi:small subunit ribosomal protein S17